MAGSFKTIFHQMLVFEHATIKTAIFLNIRHLLISNRS
jgi:hypothetical protein